MSPDEESPTELLRRAAAGDDAALERLWAAHVDGLYAFVLYRVGRDASLAEDVVGDTFLHALAHADAFDETRGSLRTWLCMASRNVIRGHLRAHRRAAELDRTWQGIDATLSQVFAALETMPLPPEVLAREDTRELVNMTIANLPDAYRNALQRKYVEGQTLHDIASALQVTEDAAKSLLARARRAFRETFCTLDAAFGEAP